MEYLKTLINWTRIKALLWHTGAQIVGFLISDFTTAVSSHKIIVPAWAAVVLGLILAQATKALQNYNEKP